MTCRQNIRSQMEKRVDILNNSAQILRSRHWTGHTQHKCVLPGKPLLRDFLISVFLYLSLSLRWKDTVTYWVISRVN